MDVIKGGLFGKLLKQLFTILLISCSIFLVSSSVNASFEWTGGAYYSPVNISSSEGDYIYIVDNYGNFNTNFIKSFYWNPTPENRSIVVNLGWIDGNLYYYQRGRFGNDPYYTVQGFINNWCVSPVSSRFNSLDQLHNDCTYNKSLDFVKNSFSGFSGYLFSFIGSVRPDWVSNHEDIFNFCFTDGSFDYCVACGELNCPSGVSGSLNLNLGDFENNSLYNWGNSPFNPSGNSFHPSTGSRLGGRLVTQSGYTNSEMIEAFECVGLSSNLCYGGFPINNIFDPSEQYEDFTGYIAGQGATIFDLYNLYSSSFSSMNQFLNTVLTRYKDGQINSFKTEPKALLMVGAQLNTAGLKVSYVSKYCDLLLNNNNNNIYTGSSIDDLRAQSCYRSKKVQEGLKNSEGDEIIFQTTPDYFGSGDDVDFDANTFFSTIMDEITTKLDNPYTGYAVGIIPGYIVIFLLAFIFIRLISH